MADRVDYLSFHNFRVEIEGVEWGKFRDVDGIGSSTEVIAYQDGDDSQMRKRPGKTTFNNLVLRRGLLNDDSFLKWRRSVEQGKTERKSGSIVLLADDMSEAVRYNFFEAWPCRWEGPSLKAGSKDDNGVEVIELCIERLEKA